MATQIILLVHGMGTHPDGEIAKTFKRAVTDAAKCLGFANFNLDQEDCQLAEYNYSGLLDEVRQQFADNAAARQAGFGHLAGAGFAAELIQKLTDFETRLGTDDFLYTHWLDVLLYGATFYGPRIRAEFAGQFHDLASQHGHANVHVIAHSLGTAVVHDTFAQLYRTGANIFDNIPDYPPGNFNISTLWMFANVSRLLNLLNGLEDPNHSTVVPGGNGCADFMFNIRHQLDPFTWFKQYKRTANDLFHLENEVVREINTHDFYEYVAAPLVSRTILETLFGKTIAQDRFDACVIQHAANTISTGVTELKTALENLRDDPGIDDLKRAYLAYKKLVEIAESQGIDI